MNRFVENFQDSEKIVRQICNKNASQLLTPPKISISMVKILRKDIRFGERIYTPGVGCAGLMMRKVDEGTSLKNFQDVTIIYW